MELWLWLYSRVLSPAGDYEELCPGGPGFRPNTVTVILEGNYDNGQSPDLLLNQLVTCVIDKYVR